MNTALLFSGGLDSYIAYFYLQDQLPKNEWITPIYIDYKGKYCKKEMKNVRNLLPQTIIIENILDFSQMEIGDKYYIPNRNLHFAAIAAEYGNKVIMGGLKDDNVSDKSPEFCQYLSMTLSRSLGRKITVDSPFWNLEKVDIIKWFLDRFGHTDKSKSHLLQTTSCYSEKEHYCGACSSCFRKMCALNYNGFNLPFYNLDLAKEYYEKRFEYSGQRRSSIIKACKELGIKDE